MKIVIISIICVVVYLVGMFITKIVITVYDNSVSPSERVDDFDIVFMDFDIVCMIIWPIVLPMIGVYSLFRKQYKIAENIGNKISMKLRNRKAR